MAPATPPIVCVMRGTLVMVAMKWNVSREEAMCVSVVPGYCKIYVC